jgi:AhpD family alkylhydroperoxidase
MKYNLNKSRTFSFFYHQTLIVKAAIAFSENQYLKREKLLNLKWKERIMLAVTEVNQCTMCSWMHTNIALKAGMKEDEIKNILSGSYDEIPNNELLSILYAQDYASNKETINKPYVAKLIEAYGVRRTRMIKNVISIITMTTSMGIAIGKLKATFTGKHVRGSNVFSELFIPLSTMILFPFIALLGLVVSPFRLLKKKS